MKMVKCLHRRGMPRTGEVVFMYIFPFPQKYYIYQILGDDHMSIRSRKRRALLLLERRQLKADIENTRHRMDSVRNHFEHEVDPTLIDCCIYELNAAQLRYQFLLRRFKDLEGAR